MEAEIQQQETEMTCASPGEQSSVVADLARSDPVMELAVVGEVVAAGEEGREKGDDTGEELTDKSDVDEWEGMEEVQEEQFVKTEKIISTDDVVIPQNLPDPERQRETPPACSEDPGVARDGSVQRVAVDEGQELREDGFTVIRRQTTLYHYRTEFIGYGPGKVERLLGTDVEEQVTELAPGVQLPYNDDEVEVDSVWDEFEDCLPDGTWLKKKTTRTTVSLPPSRQVPDITRSPDETSFLPLDSSECGLVDSGYREDTSRDLVEEDAVETDSHVPQFEATLPSLEEPAEQAIEKPTVAMMPEIIRDLIGREGTIHGFKH